MSIENPETPQMMANRMLRVTGYPVSAEGQAMQKKFWGELSAKLEGIAPGSTGSL